MSGWTFHGGRLAEACAYYGGEPEAWLDLSTGINPNPWPGAARIPIDWRRLPDGHALTALEAAAAAHFGVDPAHVCAVPGTEMGLRLLGTLLQGEARHIEPGYRTHGEMFAGSGLLRIEDLAEAGGANLILANPSNPEGRVLERARLRTLLDRLSATSNWLVIDEAFADAVPEESLTAEIGEERPLIIFRSFGKFFGLAGVRLGFVLGPTALLAPMRARIGSWPLSAAALAIGTAAYRDRRWIAQARHDLASRAALLDELLLRHGLTPRGHCPLFRLISTTDAAALFDRLARRTILTRPFDHDRGWLRIGLPGDEQALARLDAALGHG